MSRRAGGAGVCGGGGIRGRPQQPKAGRTAVAGAAALGEGTAGFGGVGGSRAWAGGAPLRRTFGTAGSLAPCKGGTRIGSPPAPAAPASAQSQTAGAAVRVGLAGEGGAGPDAGVGTCVSSPLDGAPRQGAPRPHIWPSLPQSCGPVKVEAAPHVCDFDQRRRRGIGQQQVLRLEVALQGAEGAGGTRGNCWRRRCRPTGRRRPARLTAARASRSCHAAAEPGGASCAGRASGTPHAAAVRAGEREPRGDDHASSWTGGPFPPALF